MLVEGAIGGVRQQVITWANVDQDLCHHIASLGHNMLTHWALDEMAAILQRLFQMYFLAWTLLHFDAIFI